MIYSPFLDFQYLVSSAMVSFRTVTGWTNNRAHDLRALNMTSILLAFKRKVGPTVLRIKAEDMRGGFVYSITSPNGVCCNERISLTRKTVGLIEI